MILAAACNSRILRLCAIEQRPPKLDLENYPHLPPAQLALTRTADYKALLPAGGRQWIRRRCCWSTS
jgi:hypothetical protein